jgi:hypothetical protein
MHTLVAAPIGRRKHYSLLRWVQATEAYNRLLVTDEPDYAEELRTMGLPVVEYEPKGDSRRPGANAMYGPAFNTAWHCILENTDGYSHVLGLDTDVIPEGDILSYMEENMTDGIDFLRHGVPWRGVYRRDGMRAYETSCTLAKVETGRMH